jgi:hypothetical protein
MARKRDSRRFRERKGKEQVNFSNISKYLLLALALSLATSAFAASKENKGSIQLSDPAAVAGHQLAVGGYKLTWNESGSKVEVMFLSNGKLVATVPAHLIELTRPEAYSHYEVRTKDDGSKILTNVGFGGKKYTLAFGDETTVVESASQSSR